MTPHSIGHPLNTLVNGVVGFADDTRFTPLVSMNITVRVNNGLATVVMSRSFENMEKVPIEAILTFPISFQAVVTSLKAQIDGRELTARAQARDEAREAYEDAIDRGVLAVLHEEPLRGLHLISIAPLAPKQKVVIIATYIMPLANIGGELMLNIPTTVGELYGNSPLLPVDDIALGANALMKATLQIEKSSGRAILNGALIGDCPLEIKLNKRISLTFPNAIMGKLYGHDALGRSVTLTLKKEKISTRPLNFIVLFDRSYSTHIPINDHGQPVWSCMQNGLRKALQELSDKDSIELWQFDNECQNIGSAEGANSSKLVDQIGAPRGGTDLGAAINQLNNTHQSQDILILTDGQTWAAEAQSIAAMGNRISVVLVGQDSFEGVVGQLAFITGGEVFLADGGDVAPAISSAIQSLRNDSAAVEGTLIYGMPNELWTKRSGVAMSIAWDREISSELSDDVGKYAAAISLPLLDYEKACNYATSHDLCTHLTSLLILDEEGNKIEGVPEQRKIKLQQRGTIPYVGAARRDPSITLICGASPGLNSNHERSAAHDLLYKTGRDYNNNTIDWNNLANELLSGNISVLEDEQIKLVTKLWDYEEIRKLADKLGLDQLDVVLGLLAKCDIGKTAQRFARMALAKATVDELKIPLEITKKLMHEFQL